MGIFFLEKERNKTKNNNFWCSSVVPLLSASLKKLRLKYTYIHKNLNLIIVREYNKKKRKNNIKTTNLQLVLDFSVFLCYCYNTNKLVQSTTKKTKKYGKYWFFRNKLIQGPQETLIKHQLQRQLKQWNGNTHPLISFLNSSRVRLTYLSASSHLSSKERRTKPSGMENSPRPIHTTTSCF